MNTSTNRCTASGPPEPLASKPTPEDTEKGAWITRCTARYANRCGLPPVQAAAAAEARYAESAHARVLHPSAPEATPEEWADADIESWADD